MMEVVQIILNSITVYIILLCSENVIEYHYLIVLLVKYHGNLQGVHCLVNLPQKHLLTTNISFNISSAMFLWWQRLKQRSKITQIVELRVAITCACTHKGPILHYKA